MLVFFDRQIGCLLEKIPRDAPNLRLWNDHLFDHDLSVRMGSGQLYDKRLLGVKSLDQKVIYPESWQCIYAKWIQKIIYLKFKKVLI